MKSLTQAVFVMLMTYVLCTNAPPVQNVTSTASHVTTETSSPATSKSSTSMTNSSTGTTKSSTNMTKSATTIATPTPPAGNSSIPTTTAAGNGGSSVSISSLWTVCLSVAFFEYYSRY